MADHNIYFEVLTPEKNLYDGFVRVVYFPAEGGYLGILPGHAPLVTKLGVGVITCEEEGGGIRKFFCSGGFAEVLGSDVRILATVAEASDTIDTERAGSARNRAEERIHSGNPDIDYDRALSSLHRALERLRTAGGGR